LTGESEWVWQRVCCRRLMISEIEKETTTFPARGQLPDKTE
jgi:hypothetical protein